MENIIGVIAFWAIGHVLVFLLWWLAVRMTFKNDKPAPIRLPPE